MLNIEIDEIRSVVLEAVFHGEEGVGLYRHFDHPVFALSYSLFTNQTYVHVFTSIIVLNLIL